MKIPTTVDKEDLRSLAQCNKCGQLSMYAKDVHPLGLPLILLQCNHCGWENTGCLNKAQTRIIKPRRQRRGL